jgi:hypothetical protein
MSASSPTSTSPAAVRNPHGCTAWPCGGVRPSWSAVAAMKLSLPGGSPCPSGREHWRAGCWETSKPCSGRGRRSRTPTGTSPAAYFTLETSGGSDSLAEFNRALRFAVLWRKLMHGTYSEKGDRWVERILSLRETCRLRGIPTFPILVEAVTCAFKGRHPDTSWI